MSRIAISFWRRLTRWKRLKEAPFAVEFDDVCVRTYQIDPDDVAARRDERAIVWKAIQCIRGVNRDVFTGHRLELWLEGDGPSDFLLIHEDMRGWLAAELAVRERFPTACHNWRELVGSPFVPPHEVEVWNREQRD